MRDDVRWAVRRLTRRPGFSVVFVAILGTTLGIALTIATLAEATIGAALPYEEEDALFALYEVQPDQGIDRMVSSLAAVEDWQRKARSFAALGAVRTQINVSLQEREGVARLSGAIVSRSMFDALGVSPVPGRSFDADEDRAGSGIPSVILSHDIWRNRFAGDPGILGRAVTLNGSPWTIVGVLPATQTLAPHYDAPVDVWLPAGMAGQLIGTPVYTSRAYRMFQLIGRVRPGTSEADVARDVAALTTELAAGYPESSQGWEWRSEPLRARVLGAVAVPVKALLVGGILLFAVAVVNLLALYIQRARTEHGEVATRLAIGASTRDIIRLSTAELGLLGLLAGIVGIGVAAASMSLLPWWLPLDLPAHVRVSFSWRMAGIGIVCSTAALVLVGLTGMSVVARGLAGNATVGGRVIGSTFGATRLAQASLGAQVALSTLLAIGSAIALRSFTQLSAMNPGVEPEGLVALRVDVPPEVRDERGVEIVADEILRRIESIPAVREAFLWSPHVPTRALWYTRVRLFDRPEVADADLPAVRFNTVSAGAVNGIGLEIVAGRDLMQQDRDTGRRVMLVSATAARTWWGSEQAAIGRRVKKWNHTDWSEIVGVARDAPLSGRQGEGSDFFTDVYFLFGQDVQRDLVFFARQAPGARVQAEELQAAVHAAASDLPAYDIRSMDARLSEQDALARGSALLSAVFAATAIILAALGLYGALSFAVNTRRKEIGLRQALGATPRRVMRELAGSGVGVVGLGMCAGTVLAWFGLRPVAPTLFLIGPHDPASYLGANTLLLLASLIALAVPAARALRISPGDSLRNE